VRNKKGSKEHVLSRAHLLPMICIWLKFNYVSETVIHTICYMAACKAAASFPATETRVAASLFL
jgi:hypothetical protein